MEKRKEVKVRVTKLRDHGTSSDLASSTPEERWEMMWELAKDAWAFKGEPVDESRLQRHIVRVLRRER